MDLSPFVRDCWYVAAWDFELVAGKPLACMMLNEPIVLYRDSRGGVVALEDRCVHRLAPLSLGRIEGDDLRCMYHGMKFNPGGRCVEIPMQDMVPERACVRSYPVRERDSWIWVWMGEADKADESLIPQSIGLDDPAWMLTAGQKDINANWELMNDNLCDLSHVAFVHENTLAVGSPAWSETPASTQRISRGVRNERWVPGGRMIGPDGAFHPVDRWTGNDYVAPGIFLIEDAYYPSGEATPTGETGRPEGVQPRMSFFSAQAVTPMTDQQTRYFYSVGPRADLGTPQLKAGSFAMVQAAFEEDRVMLEAQQRSLNLSPDSRMLTIGVDKAVNLMRRVMRDIREGEPAVGQAADRAAPQPQGTCG